MVLDEEKKGVLETCCENKVGDLRATIHARSQPHELDRCTEKFPTGD